MKRNMILIHGGGPTAVINASVYGVIRKALESGRIGRVYGAIGGMEGVLNERLAELSAYEDSALLRLFSTPGSALGSSRFPLCEADYERIVPILEKFHIQYVLMNGGNGTMDTCGRLCAACRGHDIQVVGIPKTIDNDISCVDHTPGYASAARFLATSVREIGQDVKSLPIHVSIMEAMGRNAGWLTASAALAREKKGDAPHLVYLPERPFIEEEFLEDVKKLYEEKGGVVVVVSEGLRGPDGNPLVPPVFRTERAAYYGDVSAYLAQLVIKKLGIKARSEKPGLLGRASMALRSPVDVREAEWMGREAVEALLNGKSGVMVGIVRKKGQEGYEPECITIPIAEVMMEERKLPEDYINARGNDVTDAFVQWLRPLIGAEMEAFQDFMDDLEKKTGR